MASNKGWTTDEDLGMADASIEPPACPELDLYALRLNRAEPEQVGKEGKPGVRLEFKILRSYGGTDGELDGKFSTRVTHTMGITKETAFNAKRLAMAAGVEPPTRSNIEAIEEFCAALMSAPETIHAVIGKREGTGNYAGRFFANLQRFVPADQCDEEAGKVRGTAGAGAANDAAAAPPKRARRTA